jgi:pimeloyl-ACP methyl ester carboxylesterase
MLSEKTFDTGAVTLNYAEGPSNGRPLVLLHGVTTWWQTFLPVLPGLLVRYHTYALDLRGHGRSSWTPGAYTISHDVADVSAFLRAQLNEPAVLLGWSLGGMVATLVAAHAPELVRAVVLEDPPLATLTDDDSCYADFYEHMRKLRAVMAMVGSDGSKLSALATLCPDLNALQLRSYFKQLSQCDPEFIIEKQKFEQYRLEKVLPKITCPVLLLQGNPHVGGQLDDQTTQVAVSLLADCVHVYLPDVGHNIHSERPTQYFQLVGDFMESL